VGATGAWLGFYFVILAIFLSLPFLVILTLLLSGYRIIAKGKLPQPVAATEKKARKKSGTTYSLPFTLGVYVLLTVLMIIYVQALNAISG
jgi:hypothetical protein